MDSRDFHVANQLVPLIQQDNLLDTSRLPILRLEAGIDFGQIPEALQAQICTLLGVREWDPRQFSTQLVQDDENNRIHYAHRVEAIFAGVEFLLQSHCNPHFKHEADLIKYFSQLKTTCTTSILSQDRNDINVLQSCLANYTEANVTILAAELGLTESVVMDQLSRAEELALALQPKQPICTVSTLPGRPSEYIVTIDTPVNPFENPALIAELKLIKQADLNKLADNIPAWFVVLAPHEKHLIQYFLNQFDIDRDLGHQVNALSSKFRLIPAPSNYGTHTLVTWMTSKGNEHPSLIVHSPELRSAHTASRDVTKQTKRIRHEHAVRNIQCEIERIIQFKLAELESILPLAGEHKGELVIPILYQTLITPLKDPDSALELDRSEAINIVSAWLQRSEFYACDRRVFFDLILTNHPLNYGKYLYPTTPSTDTGKEINVLLKLIDRYPLPGISLKDKELLSGAATLLKHHTEVQLNIFTAYRELYLASLEQVVVAAAGGATLGSCVSGKDRKAIEIAHTDAIKIFYALYNELPPMDASTLAQKDQMRLFADIFASIFCTKHQQALAAQNAPGSFGTKTPSMYLPDHLVEGIRRWYAKRDNIKDSPYEGLCQHDILKESDRMASNNDIDHIHSLSVSSNLRHLIWQPHQFHRAAVYQLDFSLLMHLASDSIMGEQDNSYLAQRTDKLGFFSTHFDSIRGQLRALAYKKLLDSNDLDLCQKHIILTALLMSGDGKNLKLTIAHALGFATVASAKNTLFVLLIANFGNKKDTIGIINTLVKVICNNMNDITKADELDSVIALVKRIVEPYALPSDKTATLAI